MPSRSWRSSLALLTPLVLAGCPATKNEPPEGFVARRDAEVVDQPGGKRPVAHLQKGKRYNLLKRGGPDRGWCKLDVGKETGWILCAESENAAPASVTATTTTATTTAAATATATTTATTTATAPAAATGFAYWVLTLSWSPAFCETGAGERSAEQCGKDRHYGFVVHGLWPQNEKGWPESCTRSDDLSPALVKSVLDIMPSEQLVRHEWQKHGTCSELPAETYFERVRTAFQSIHIPTDYVAPAHAFDTDLEHIENAFVGVNPGLTGDAIAVKCKRELDEVSICLGKDLRPRRCGGDVRDQCRGTVHVPPLR